MIDLIKARNNGRHIITFALILPFSCFNSDTGCSDFALKIGFYEILYEGRGKKAHKQISHLTRKSQDLIDLNAHGSEYDNFNINEQMSSFIMHAI